MQEQALAEHNIKSSIVTERYYRDTLQWDKRRTSCAVSSKPQYSIYVQTKELNAFNGTRTFRDFFMLLEVCVEEALSSNWRISHI